MTALEGVTAELCLEGWSITDNITDNYKGKNNRRGRIFYRVDAILFGLFGYFFTGGSPTCFGLGRGPITPPGPAVVRMDRKDLNSNKKGCHFCFLNYYIVPRV